MEQGALAADIVMNEVGIAGAHSLQNGTA
jgi:hypothetical protein